MPEDLTTGQETSSHDQPFISIADLNKATDDNNQVDEAKLKEIADSKNKDKKSDAPSGEGDGDQKAKKTEDKGDPDPKKADEDGDQGKEGASDKKEGDPDSEEDKYKLDPKVAEAFPEQAKRYEEQRQGLLKREKQIGEHQEEYDILSSWRKGLESKEHQIPCLKDLLSGVANLRGSDLKTLITDIAKTAAVELDFAQAKTETSTTSTDDPKAWIHAGFDSPEDYELHMKTVGKLTEEITAKVTRELTAQMDAKFGPVLKTTQEQAAATAFNESVNKALPNVQKYLDLNAAGYPVTKEQLGKAMKEAPGLSPEKAVDAIYANEIRKHVAEKQAESYGKQPREMTSSKASQARKTLKNPSEVTIHDLNEQLDS